MTRTLPKKLRQRKFKKDLCSAQHHKAKAAHIFIVLVLVIFALGFSSEDNPLLGKWKCDVDKTMESLDTSNMSDIEKKSYIEYFKSIKHKVTEDKMVTETVTATDSTTYKIEKQKDNKVYVYYPEEDEKDTFILLDKNNFKLSKNIKNMPITIYFERQ